MPKLTTYVKRCLGYVVSGQPKIEVKALITVLNPSEQLKGKKILITGGGRGLGKAMAEKFISEGAQVVVSGRNEEILKTTACELGCKYIKCDVTSGITGLNALVENSKRLLGGLNVLVNNAGVSLHEGDQSEVTEQNFDVQFDANLKGAYFLTQSFIKQTDDEPTRDILFISSERGFQSDDLPYGLTKAAINSLIKGLAFRYVKKGIRVNGVAPGVTSSDMTKVGMDGNLYYPPNTNHRAYLPEEVAEVASFLISPASSCVSGQIICCNEAKTVNAHWR